jgi:hypothetical protein
MTKGTRTAIITLFVLVTLSLALNGLLLWQWWNFQQQAVQTVRRFEPVITTGLTQAIADLDSLQHSTMQFKVQIKQDFPVQVEIPFKQAVEVPIQTTMPISQVLQTTIMLDPFQTGLNIPTDITVPINLEIPIDITVPVAIDRTIPISTTVPLNLDVPVNIKISETELAPFLQRLQTALESAAQTLSNLNP